jgi:hypothetical protein
MARRRLVNMAHLITQTGLTLSSLTNVAAAGTYVSREIYDLNTADSVAFYYGATSLTGTPGTLQLSLLERDPVSGAFATQTDMPAFASIAATVANLRTPSTATLWQPQGECYKLQWILTTFTAATFYCVAVVTQSGG